jgi:CBS domain-containing protein
LANFKLSPAIVVPADMSIGDAVRKMRDNKVGSLMIVRETKPHDLIGVFTERDLLFKIDEIQHGGYWKKGVGSVMTHPVITLSVYELKRAPQIMKQHHIRHLPVVYVDEQGQNHIVGVIGMRDLFKSYVDAGGTSVLERSSNATPRIALACKDPISIGMLRTILSQDGKAKIVEVETEALLNDVAGFIEAKKPDLLVVDLDHISAARWARLLQQLRKDANSPTCVVLFTPGMHESKNTAVLGKLSETGKVAAFAKPVDVLGLLQRLEAAIRSKS